MENEQIVSNLKKRNKELEEVIISIYLFQKAH
jgi:hypothetical protein